VEQDLYAGDGQQQRQPEGLLQSAGDLVLAAGAAEVGNAWRDGLQDTGEGKEHRDVDAAANGHRRQIFGPVVAEKGGVDDHHAHRRQLRDQHRRRVRDNQAGLLSEHRWQERRGPPRLPDFSRARVGGGRHAGSWRSFA
jgi:hypothetical protein